MDNHKGRCMRCRAEREIFDPVITTNKKGINYVRGVCKHKKEDGTECGTTVCRILGKKKD